MMYASIQWFILTFVSMFFYAGGTITNPTSPGYDFFSNYNSDLGRTVAYSGKSNLVSLWIYTINNTIYVISMMIFFIALYYFFSEGGIDKWMGLLGSISGIFVGIGLLGAVFTPWDLYPELHEMFTYLSFSSILLIVIFFAIAIYLNEAYPNKYCYIHLIYMLIVILFLIVLYTGPSLTSAEGLRLQATWQKILLFASNINLLVQGYGAWKTEKARPI